MLVVTDVGKMTVACLNPSAEFEADAADFVPKWHCRASDREYCCKFELYGGKSRQQRVSQYIVSRITEPYVQTGRTLYCDNYYTSPELFLDFSHANIYTCGTKRNRKGIPNGFKDATLTTLQQMFCMTNGALLVMKYKNRRDAKMLTTAHSAKMVDPDKRTQDRKAILYQPVQQVYGGC
ncbi:Hypp6809 [Branchiostoma lanceolatum]|uniref:Hypp6809 protein n=1 Tax=Branchiostoma lanceolatum TaxID=7740 RepID=A0A8K0EAN9_BRALA|nr:Hypp6809 [Branchiostoma lanceolatum]